MFRQAISRPPAGCPLGRAALAAALALAAPAAPAAAQDGWSFAVSPYVWLPGLTTKADTPLGTVDVDTSASDAISELDFAFMGAAEARKDRWGLILDLIYSDISTSTGTPFGILFSDVEVETKLTSFTTYAGYRVFENDRGFVDLLGGGRFYWLDVDLTFDPEPGRRGRSFDVSDNWADPVLGARGRIDFTDRWFATALGDFGGFGGGSDQSWQAFASVGYQFGPRWSAQGGWRYMAVEKELDGLDVEIDLNGPILGVTYRF
jgi:hypothetical protein